MAFVITAPYHDLSISLGALDGICEFLETILRLLLTSAGTPLDRRINGRLAFVGTLSKMRHKHLG
jgi:hypothetical protein